MTLPLVLVPGLMCDHTVWEPLLGSLERNRSVAIAEHGESNSLHQMAQRMLDLAPPQFLVAGHSMGARVALEAFRLAPSRIRGIALLDTGYLPRAPGAAGHEEVRKRRALLQIAQSEGVRKMAQVWVQGMVHPDRLKDDALIENIVAMFSRKSADTFAHQIQALLDRPDASEVLRTLDVPNLILCGRQDSWAPVAQHAAMCALIPNAQLAVIDEAGHMAPMEQPVAVSLALSQWLERCDTVR